MSLPKTVDETAEEVAKLTADIWMAMLHSRNAAKITTARLASTEASTNAHGTKANLRLNEVSNEIVRARARLDRTHNRADTICDDATATLPCGSHGVL
ncbi:hypothetical protein V493_07728 [Pseudogymnoascus sp. VKM F-4281 (FW-2241)]|nr:hypothetical protein V493_07728 [Pseudogymnoascus sp. VKM F-4281 (FW-2241)]